MADVVRVFTTASTLEGEIVRSRLEDEGIPVMLKGGGGDPYRMGPVDVYVPTGFEVQARLILDTLPDEVEAPGAAEPEEAG